jgi:hypothetical protein
VHDPLERQIEQDLAWREAEIGALKLLAASSPAGSDRERALLRACVAMLYAHYEGFCKFCWDLLLDSIEQSTCKRKHLTDPVRLLSLKHVFKALRADVSDERLWAFASNELEQHLEEP